MIAHIGDGSADIDVVWVQVLSWHRLLRPLEVIAVDQFAALARPDAAYALTFLYVEVKIEMRHGPRRRRGMGVAFRGSS